MDSRQAGHDARRDHDDRMITLYEIVGTYFVEIFYNSIYKVALRQVEDSKAHSVTEAYQNATHAYVTEIQHDSESYLKTMGMLHDYVRHHTEHSMSNYSTFVDRVVSTLVQAEFYRSMIPKDKDEIIASAVCDLVAALAVFSTKPENLPRIIDKRSGADRASTVTMMQDFTVTTLLSVRDRFHSKFLGRATGAKETVSSDLVAKLKKAIRVLAKEKATLMASNAKLREELEDVSSKYSAKKADLVKAVQFCHQVQAYSKELEARVATLTTPGLPPPTASYATSSLPLGNPLGAARHQDHAPHTNQPAPRVSLQTSTPLQANPPALHTRSQASAPSMSSWTGGQTTVPDEEADPLASLATPSSLVNLTDTTNTVSTSNLQSLISSPGQTNTHQASASEEVPDETSGDFP